MTPGIDPPDRLPGPSDDTLASAAARHHGRLGGAMVLVAGVAVGVAAYLTWSKLGGSLPACGPVAGCEEVATSRYAEFLGIPVALFGLAASLLTLVAALAWWRRRSRRALWLVYGLGLASLPVLVWLTWLELFVILAVCSWCVTYAVAVVAGWVLSLVALRDDPGPQPAPRPGP